MELSDPMIPNLSWIPTDPVMIICIPTIIFGFLWLCYLAIYEERGHHRFHRRKNRLVRRATR